MPEPREALVEIPDARLVESAVRNIGFGRPFAPRWVQVRDVFAVGSTTATELCRRFGFDPYETVGTRPRISPE